MRANICSSFGYQFLLSIGYVLLSIGEVRAARAGQVLDRTVALPSNLVAQVKRSPAPVPGDDQNPDEEPKPADPKTTPPNNSTPLDRSFFLKKIEFKCGVANRAGCTVFKLNSPEIRSIVQSVEGRETTLAQLQNVANKITQLYLNKGYITSSGSLIDQTVVNGIVVIQISEGGIDRIQVEGNKRVNPEYIKSRIGLAQLTPLNQSKLEERLRLLRIDPLFKNVEASIRANNVSGQSLLIVRVTEAESFKGNATIDNYSPPSVGSEQVGVNLAYTSLIGSGDRLSATYKRSTTGGASLYDFGYSIPLNPTDGNLQIRAAINDYRITDSQFSALNIRGKSSLYEINYRQPLVNTTTEEFALGLGFSLQDGQTFIFNQPNNFGFGPDLNGVSRTSVFKFSQEYIKRDLQGAWSARSQFNIGTGLFGATVNSGSIPDSRFLSWTAQGQRLQQLNNNNLLIATLDAQLTTKSLLTSQQFVVGGGQSVRGFRQNARYGDNGLRLSIEDRITLTRNETGSSVFQVAPFFDTGVVWNQGDNPNNGSLPDRNFLAGAGLGLLWEPLPQLNVRLDYGLPLINLRDKGNNLQDSGLYFNVTYGF